MGIRPRREALRDVLDLLLPGACLGCGRRIPPGRADSRICGVCRSRVRPLPEPGCRRCQAPRGTGGAGGEGCQECAGWPPALAAARSAAVLRPPADRLVHALKYEGWREVAAYMAGRMADGARALGPTWAGAPLVPVPTTRRRRRRRGYNQAEALADGLARALDREVVNALERRAGDRTQVVLQPSQRRANVRAAFGVRAAVPVPGRPVILVDDVLTTGATAGAAARILESAGAGAVAVVTFARALAYRT